MPFTLTDILYGGVAPVIVAGVLLLVVRRFLPDDLGERYSAVIALLSGFMTGYGLLGLAPWMPTAHWHWLPFAMLGATVVGPVACADGVRSIERILLYVTFAAMVAWFLVPTWDDLAPSRLVFAVAFVVYVTALASLLEPLARRMPGPMIPAILWLTMTAAAIVLALSGSLRFAQIGLAGAAALLGIVLVACFRRDTNSLTGIGLLFSVMAVGSLLIGRVNSFSEVPLAAYLMVPTAPLLLWSCTFGPLAKITGVKRPFAQATLPIALLVGSIILAAIADLSSPGEY